MMRLSLLGVWWDCTCQRVTGPGYVNQYDVTATPVAIDCAETWDDCTGLPADLPTVERWYELDVNAQRIGEMVLEDAADHYDPY